MRSPCRAHPLASPMVPAGPHRLGWAYPAQHHGCGSWLRLSSSSLPMGTRPTQHPAVHVAGTIQAPWSGAWQEPVPRLAGSKPPKTRGRARRVSALSPPGTTEGQHLAGESRGPSPTLGCTAYHTQVSGHAPSAHTRLWIIHPITPSPEGWPIPPGAGSFRSGRGSLILSPSPPLVEPVLPHHSPALSCGSRQGWEGCHKMTRAGHPYPYRRRTRDSGRPGAVAGHP